MTVWDFASELLHMTCHPGISDKVTALVLLAIVIMIAVEFLPGKHKPLSYIARKLGNALNADELARIEKLEHKSIKSERDSVRMQMLILLSDYPENEQEIMEVARHYFADIKGDWYMTSLFNNWLTKGEHGKPEWFNPKK